jgi:hypothetical protein
VSCFDAGLREDDKTREDILSMLDECFSLGDVGACYTRMAALQRAANHILGRSLDQDKKVGMWYIPDITNQLALAHRAPRVNKEAVGLVNQPLVKNND